MEYCLGIVEEGGMAEVLGVLGLRWRREAWGGEVENSREERQQVLELGAVV